MVDQLLMSLNSANGPPENENGPFSQQLAILRTKNLTIPSKLFKFQAFRL